MKPDKKSTGVVVVDIQGDFTEYKCGSLAVEGTDKAYVEMVSEVTQQLKDKGLKLFATQDWHPENHVSFISSHKDRAVMDVVDVDGRTQVLWPPHCVMETPNAEVLVDNRLFDAIVKKGCDPGFDSYSGFFDDGGADTGLNRILKEQGLNTLIVYGLATDYCVKFTAMDAVTSGFKVFLAEDLCKGVSPDTTVSALEEMKKAGIRIVRSEDIL